jgi:lipopolysaccharide export system protein LptA
VTFFAEAKDLNIVQRRKKLTADDNTVDDTNTNYVVVKANTVCKFSGLVDASELYVATSDSSTYTVRYRTEW